MNIYFHIDELNRDAVVASALKREFATYGHKLVYGNRITNRLLNYFHDAFDVIIIPRPHIVYDNWSDNWMSWDSKFIMLSTESVGIICKDHHVMARTILEKEYFEGTKKYINRIDAFCLWGNKQLSAIEEYAKEVKHKCHVVGHPRHDLQCINPKKTTPKKPTIGVITRAVSLNDYFKRSALDGFVTLLDDHFQYEYNNKITGESLISKRPASKPAESIITQALDAATTLKSLDILLKAGYEVSLRVHPKEDIEVWRSLLSRSKLKVDINEPKTPISCWIQGLDYLVGPPSTSFYDAVMLGVTPISISRLDPRRQDFIGELWEDNNRLMKFIFKPETYESLINYIEKNEHLNIENEVESILKEEADFPECKNSLAKIYDVCVPLVKIKNRIVWLLLFYIFRDLYYFVWNFRNMFRKNKKNSASFAIDYRVRRFIDDLTIG
jgi:surface carbohydrate biosynthesis protein